MLDWVGDAGTGKIFAREAAETMIVGGKPGMLAGEDQMRGNTDRRERMRQRSELDGFGTRTHNQLDTQSGKRSP